MYTDEQYQRAKAQIGGADPAAKAILRQRIREYELTNPQHGVELSGVDRLDATAPKEQSINVPELPTEAPAAETLGVPAEIDTTRDASLPNASGLKVLAAPPEYAPKNPLRTVAHIATAIAGDPLDGPSAGMFFEPSKAQFQADMGDVLKARGISPEDSPHEYETAYNEYRDRQWAKAYQQAQTEDRPLTRAAFVHRSGQWEKLAGMLETIPDVASTFAKGYVNGLVPGSRDALGAASDVATGRNDVGADREQAARNPTAAGVGEFMGSISPASLLSRVAGAAYAPVSRLLPGVIGKGAAAAAGGIAAGDTDLTLRSAGQAAGDIAHGGNADTAKDQFTRRIIPTTLLSGLGGAVGEGIAEGASSYRRGLRAGPLGGELGNLEAGGGSTDLVRGIKPPPEVEANIEAARPPVPGENKPTPAGSALEIQASKLQGPITSENASSQKALRQSIAAEESAAYDADPALQKPVPVKKTANAAVDLLKARSQPEAEGAAFVPAQGDALPARNNSPFRDFAMKLWKPKLVLGVDAARAAEASGGKVVSLDEARQLGFQVGSLPDAEGVPIDAPPIPDTPSGLGFPAANPVETLPRYPKEALASAPSSRATPEQAAAIKRYTFGKRDTGDEQLIDSYLRNSDPSPSIPHVYRGIVLPKEEAAAFLNQDVIDMGPGVASASVDPVVARSFVARNQEPGSVGVTLKLETQSARDIRHLADSQVGAEKEFLLPGDTKFQVVSRHSDPTNPGNYIVVAREVPAPRASSTEEVFGRPADKILPGVAPRRPRVPKERPAPIPGSDWDNPAEQEARFNYIFEDQPQDRRAVPRSDDITPTRVSNSPPMRPPAPPPSRGAPAGPPSEILAAATPSPPPPSIPGPPPGVPDREYRVVLEPREYDAKKFEELVGSVDHAAKAGREGAAVDPAWKDFQRAVREDREQFGPEWSAMKARHHEALTALEQRAGHANIRGEHTYSEMDANAQKSFNSGLVNYGAKGTSAESNQALRSLAEKAGVMHELETLRAQRATESLSQEATPSLRESAGMGGMFTRVGGLGTAIKIRADAAARGLSRGTYGSASLRTSDISPELLDLVRRGAPVSREVTNGRRLPGVVGMGGGALGLKVGSVYNGSDRTTSKSLTPEQVKYLEKLLDATRTTQ